MLPKDSCFNSAARALPVLCLLAAGCRQTVTRKSLTEAGDAAACALTFYVATNGADTAEGSLEKPFATLERARDAIRSVRRTGGVPAGGATVFVRGGRYEFARTFVLAAEDGGTEQAPVVYRAYGHERPVLTGDRRIGGFVPHKGQIVKADLGAQGLRNVYSRQLFFNGERQHIARYPNFDPANPHGGGFAYVAGALIRMSKALTNETRRVVTCKPEDCRRWAKPREGEVFIYPRYNWRSCLVPIASADWDKRQITLTSDVWSGATHTIRAGDRYYVRNLFEELDAPGEWYLDRATRTLYFWPPAPLADAEVSVAALKDLVQIGPGSAWITLRGFDIRRCEGNGVTVSESTNCLVAANRVHGIGGGAAIRIEGGRNCSVRGNDVWDTCHQGVVVEGGDAETLTPGGHVVDNNYIHHIGTLNGHAAGIMLRGVGLRVSHNLIHDTTRSGIYGGGNDCVIEYNRIRHTNLETEDTGGYYNGGGWHIRGQVIRFNYIHDALGYGRHPDGTWGWPHSACCIYLDDDHSGTTVYGNILARSATGGVFVHGGRDNRIENNILVEHALRQVTYSGHDPASDVVARHWETFSHYRHNPAYAKYPEIGKMDRATAWRMSGNRFERNIICYRNPQAKLYTLRRNDFPEENVFDYNLVWHFGQALDTDYPPPENGRKTAEAAEISDTWEAWRTAGFDAHSVVADPLFVDPDQGDYRLRPESPAFKLGFKAIPVEQIGPYKDSLRATWPVVEAAGVREQGLPGHR